MLTTNDMGRFDVATTDALELPMFKLINKIPWHCIRTNLAFGLKSTTARYTVKTVHAATSEHQPPANNNQA